MDAAAQGGYWAVKGSSPEVPGALLGGVNYVSPEACNGETLDNRADIWALGVLLYEMLTGELPFVGDSLVAAITAILTRPVPD
jgi:serine/threonine protein kinase